MIPKFTLLFTFLLLAVSLIHPESGPNPDQFSNSNNAESKEEFYTREYEMLQEPALNRKAFQYALQGYTNLVSQGQVSNDSLVTIIDFSLPSSEERFFVIDLSTHTVVYKSLVSHGRNSGELYATNFSNVMQSHTSALGFYITKEPYTGGQGYSLLLEGLDKGYNDLARERSIVIHGADYATEKYIEKYGRLGRSFGCPALPPELTAAIINLIKNGSVLFCYFPDQEYLLHSSVLGSTDAETPAL